MSSTTIDSRYLSSSSFIFSSCCPISLRLRFSRCFLVASVRVFFVRYFKPVDSRVNAPVLVVADMPAIDAPLPIVAPIERVAAARMPG